MAPSATDMGNYLEVLAQQQSERTAHWLLHRVQQCLENAANQSILLAPEWDHWRDLIRFALGTQSIAAWLRDEPAALQRIHALVTLSQQDVLADLLSEALQGSARPPAAITFSQLGEDDLVCMTGSLQGDQYDGQDWSGTDTAIELANEGFAQVIAQLLLAEREHLSLPLPNALAKHALPDRQDNADANAHHTLTDLVEQGQALTLLNVDTRAATIWANQHQLGPSLDDDLQAFYQALFDGSASLPLIHAFGKHNGAELFCHHGTVGLTLFPIDEWDRASAAMLARAKSGYWQSSPDDIPEWLQSAVAFAQGPHHDEHWILISEGPLTGAVMLAEIDAPHARVRYPSVAAFFQALMHTPGRVLGATGQLHYAAEGFWYEPSAQ